MADNKYSFIVVKYPKQETGEAALAVVVGLSKENLIKLKDAVAITKTENGKIKLHQTKDDGAKKGFLKGGAIGVLFALLLGPAGWIAAGAALGTAFSLFDRGIKNKLLKELGENMTSEESALAVLVESADWDQVFSRMQSNNFNGQIVVQEVVDQDAAAFEQLVNAASAPAAVPEEVSVDAAPVAPAAEDTPAEEAPAAEAPDAPSDSEPEQA